MSFSNVSSEPWILVLAVASFMILYGLTIYIGLKRYSDDDSLDALSRSFIRRRRNGILDIEAQKKIGFASADGDSDSSSSSSSNDENDGVFATPSKRSESSDLQKESLVDQYSPQEKLKLNEFYHENFETKCESSSEDDHDPHNARGDNMDEYKNGQGDASSLSSTTSSNETSEKSDSTSSVSSSEEPDTEESVSESSSSSSDSTKSSDEFVFN